MPLDTEVGLGPGHVVLDGDPATGPPKAEPPNIRPMFVVVKRLDGSIYPPIFGPCLLWPNDRPSQLLLSTCKLSCNSSRIQITMNNSVQVKNIAI